jgi:hypothetical protein
VSADAYFIKACCNHAGVDCSMGLSNKRGGHLLFAEVGWWRTEE